MHLRPTGPDRLMGSPVVIPASPCAALRRALVKALIADTVRHVRSGARAPTPRSRASAPCDCEGSVGSQLPILHKPRNCYCTPAVTRRLAMGRRRASSAGATVPRTPGLPKLRPTARPQGRHPWSYATLPPGDAGRTSGRDRQPRSAADCWADSGPGHAATSITVDGVSCSQGCTRPLPDRSVRGPASWSAVLLPGAALARAIAPPCWLGGLLDEPPTPYMSAFLRPGVCCTQPGIRIHLSRALDHAKPTVLHPAAAPPRIRLEVALLDQCEIDTASQITHLVLSAIQRRLTTADRISTVIDGRSRHRWRGLITTCSAKHEQDVASPLELRYRRDVELGHALPIGIRNRGERRRRAGRVPGRRYQRWRLIVELDGQETHPDPSAFRDLRRDNRATVGGDATLRYGWRDIAGDPCAVAVQVALVLAGLGWNGRPRPCSPACRVPPPSPDG